MTEIMKINPEWCTVEDCFDINKNRHYESVFSLGTGYLRYNTIAPGTIDTERNRKADPNYPDDWIPFIPMGRVGQVEEIAKPVVFLCCDDSSYMTGQNIYVAGGETDYVPMPHSEFMRRGTSYL